MNFRMADSARTACAKSCSSRPIRRASSRACEINEPKAVTNQRPMVCTLHSSVPMSQQHFPHRTRERRHGMAGRDVVDVDLCEADALAKSIHTYRRNPELSAAGGGLSVILSEAKDLMPVVSGDEILRFAQDDEGEKRLIPPVASAPPSTSHVALSCRPCRRR